MSKTRWSVPTWILFHGLAEKIDEDFYKANNEKVFNIVKIICQNLPCPYCRENASKYLKKIKIKNIKTKEEFKTFLFTFHNHVNKKLKKKEFELSILNKYKLINMFKAYTWFDQNFYGSYIISHDFNKWRRNLVNIKVKEFFSENWKQMF